jgi:hypothetical protein
MRNYSLSLSPQERGECTGIESIQVIARWNRAIADLGRTFV